MIRPMVVSMYDYKMVFMQEPNQQLRNGYKALYLEASAFRAANEIYSNIDQKGIDPEQAIRQWNETVSKGGSEGNEEKSDFRTKVDEIFKSNNRSYYRNRQQERIVNREQGEGFRSPSKTNYPSKYSSSSSYQRYHSPHSKEGYYQPRYKADRF